MLNKFILKSAPLAVRLPVSPSLFFLFFYSVLEADNAE